MEEPTLGVKVIAVLLLAGGVLAAKSWLDGLLSCEAPAQSPAPMAHVRGAALCERVTRCGYKLVAVSTCLRWTELPTCTDRALAELETEMARARSCDDLRRVPSRSNNPCVRW